MSTQAFDWSRAAILMLSMIASPACDTREVPTCEQAVEVTFEDCRWFSYGYPPYGPGGLDQDPAGALAYCEDTLASAQAAGCEEAHSRFRSCMGSRKQCVDGYPRELCDREEAALHACLAGETSFELDCGNGRDDDGDGLADCWDPNCVDVRGCICESCYSFPQSSDRSVDLLFVIDDSGTMADAQTMLQAQFGALAQELRNTAGGMPDLHIGVTSTDLGAGDYGITLCEDEGARGRLLTGTCANPMGEPYLVDVSPRFCQIEMDSWMHCTSHSCTQASCAFEPSAALEIDESTGCPRCRNYPGESLEDVFTCIAQLGTQGCGFAQPLEAMRMALDDNPFNEGFLREQGILGVVFITDEDDCSASDPELFDNSATSIDSTLGPLTSFRCFEFGVSCDDDSRTSQGVREHCEPRDDPEALLHPIDRYVEFLRSRRDPQLLVVAAIAGPVLNGSVTVGRDEYDRPEVEQSCLTESGGAVPGIRMRALVDAFQTANDLYWAYTSVCSPTFTDTLVSIGGRIRDTLDIQCLRSPLRGCPDIGAEFGAPLDSCEANDICLATCRVTDVYRRGTIDEEMRFVPPCLEICQGGPCPGNTDRSRAYSAGHPEERDPSLPVEACWHIRYQETCPGSNFAEIFVARRADPPSRTFSLAGCIESQQTEVLCIDGVDNDQDCLVDGDDPDCQ